MSPSTPAYPQSTPLTIHFKSLLPHLRIDTLQRLIDIVLAMVSAQSVNLSDLAPEMPGKSTIEAKKRRAQRGVHDDQLTMQVFLVLLVAFLPPGKLLLSLDRTNWAHGESPINVLVLGVVVHGHTLPLVWIALDDGPSDTRERIWLVSHLLSVLPASRIKALVADREFVGQEWFRFLRRRGIKRAVRIKKNTKLDDLRADEWFGTLTTGQFRCLAEKTYVFGEVMRVVATRSPAGDLVIIATDFNVWDTFSLYRQRWSIECTFSSLKSRGFDLERTGITNPQRLERLFGLVVLAWLSCLRVGVWQDELEPIKLKTHGRKAISLVRSGAEYLRNVLRWLRDELAHFLPILIAPFSAPGAT